MGNSCLSLSRFPPSSASKGTTCSPIRPTSRAAALARFVVPARMATQRLTVSGPSEGTLNRPTVSPAQRAATLGRLELQ